MIIDFARGMANLKAVAASGQGADLSFDGRLAQIVATRTDLAKTSSDGLFVALPKSRPEKSKDGSRIKTVRNRLYILGYLPEDSGRGRLDAALERAVQAFQVEAGLTADGWVGEKETWPALQELVSFETPLTPSKWMRDHIPLPVLRRAVALRLYTLGFLPERPRSPDVDLDGGLSRFGKLWHLLFCESIESEPGLTPVWLSRLFKQDDLTRRLAAVAGNLSRETLNAAHGFILNVAKIELWLMGYRVNPGGYDLTRQRGTGPVTSGELDGIDIWMKSSTVTQYHQVKRNFQFYRALHLFWMDQGHDDADADAMSVGFLKNFQSFFQLVSNALQADDTVTPLERQSQVEQLLFQKKEQLPTVWDTVRSFGARIWDGVRRVWAWFRRMLTRAGHRVIEMGTNMSRLIYDFTQEAFTVVSNVFESLETMAQWVAGPVLPGSDLKQVVFIRDLDFDITPVVAADADGAAVGDCCRKLAHSSALFFFGCKVVGTFVSLLVEAFSTGWTGYFGLVLALVRIRGMAGDLQDLRDAYQQVFSAA